MRSRFRDRGRARAPFMTAVVITLYLTMFASAVHPDDERIEKGDYTGVVPGPLAIVLKRLADAKSIPYAAMISGFLALVCAFSPTAWCSGVHGNVEPLILFIKNMGASGINKTGATNYFNYLFNTVRKALVALSQDSTLCIENGVRVASNMIPVLDTTATQAALIQMQSRFSNVYGNFDEWVTQFRQATNGTAGNVAIGIQHVLTAFNGPI